MIDTSTFDFLQSKHWRVFEVSEYKSCVGLLLILVADIVVYILFLADFYYLPFRIASYLRVVFFILNIRELRDSFFILAGMLRTYLNVVALTVLFILFSSWLAYVFFEDTRQGKTMFTSYGTTLYQTFVLFTTSNNPDVWIPAYNWLAYVFFEDTRQGKTMFTSYGTTLYQTFVLFTTSNNPDVWIPAYKESRWYCFFFVLYVLLGVYFVTNLVLAVVYDSFRNELVKQVAEKDRRKLRTLKKAFSLIDDGENMFDTTKWAGRLRTSLKFGHDDGHCILTLGESNSGHTSTVWSRSFTASGDKMVSCSDDLTIEVWSNIDKMQDWHQNAPWFFWM